MRKRAAVAIAVWAAFPVNLGIAHPLDFNRLTALLLSLTLALGVTWAAIHWSND